MPGTYGIIVLDGNELPFNPMSSKNSDIKTVQRCKTLGGNYFVDWGVKTSDKIGEYQFPLMSVDDYANLTTSFLKTDTVAFVDEYGTAFTVFFTALEYETLLPGGGGFYQNVSVKLFVVSQP